MAEFNDDGSGENQSGERGGAVYFSHMNRKHVPKIHDEVSKEPRLTSQLQITHLVDQEILRFQIAVQNSMRMTVVKALDQLVGEFLQQDEGTRSGEQTVSQPILLGIGEPRR